MKLFLAQKRGIVFSFNRQHDAGAINNQITNQMSTTHSRAKAGGEFGANGEWYEGGKFINTVAENGKGKKETKRFTGKQEIEPYKWEVSADGLRSIYRRLAGIEIFNRHNMTFTFNPDLRNEFATPDAIANRKANIAAFNAGRRWA